MKKSNEQAKGAMPYPLRIPASVRDQLTAGAQKSRRSLNGQILTLIEAGEAEPKLRDAIDQIGASAEQGLALLKIAKASASPDLNPLLVGIEELFRLIGFTADSTDADARADLREVWELTQ